MRGKLFVVLVFVWTSEICWGQSELNFPKFFTAGELPNAGFAVVNPSAATATVTYMLLGGRNRTVSTAVRTIPAGGQLALSGSELFSSLGDGGWVQAISDTSGLQGFWLNYDGSLTSLDGAEAATPGYDQVIPVLTSQTDIYVANPSTSQFVPNITFLLIGENGTPIPGSFNLTGGPYGPKDIIRTSVARLCNCDTSQARYLRIVSTSRVVATAVIHGFLVPTETAVVNGYDMETQGITSEAYFPHMVSGATGGADYTTVIGVTGLGGRIQNLTFTFTPDSGGDSISVNRTLESRGSIRETAQALFNLPPGFQTGWIKVKGQSQLTAFAAYADKVSGGLAMVPFQPKPRSVLLFAHIADLFPWWTGVALLNATTSDANVEIYAMSPSGGLIGGAMNVPTAGFTIQSNGRTAKLLSEIIPETQQRTSDGGFLLVRTTNDVPLYGMELFFTRQLNILANVPAGFLSADVNYIPPVP